MIMALDQLHAGAGLTLRETLGLGFALSARPARGWRHPWQLSPGWSARAGQWVATVQPGLVNGECPIFRTTVEDQGTATARDFGLNPLTGKPYFSDPIFAPDGPAQRPERTVVNLPLYLDPALPLTMRAVGFDGGPGEGVPEFFTRLGVVAAPRVPGTNEEGPQPAPVEPPPNLRLLRACDVWVHQPRLALTSTISIEPGIATGISNVTQTLGVRSPAADDTLRVVAGKFPDPVTINPLAGDYEEQPWDDLLIGTVFLLSPLKTPLGSAPDGTWQPFVRHNLFWNLAYVPGIFRPLPGDPGTPFIPPLAGGAAQLVINFLTASLNDLTNQALNLLLGHSLAGTFYTPTGGGSTSAFPAEIPAEASGRTGLDKGGRLRAKALAAARRRRLTQLDALFPWHAQPFDPGLLTTL